MSDDQTETRRTKLEEIAELLGSQRITIDQAKRLRSLHEDAVEEIHRLAQRHGIDGEFRAALQTNPAYAAEVVPFLRSMDERWAAIVDADEPGDYSFDEIGPQRRDRRPDPRDPAYRRVERIREMREDQAARRAYLHASGLMR